MDQRAVIYCLVPAEDAAALLEPLRAHFARDPRVEVIVDRRVGPRRRERAAPPGPDRRARGDRRAPALPRLLAPLPPKLAKKALGVRFVQRLLPVAEEMAQESLDEIVGRVRAGDAAAPTELYWRVYERLRSRLSMLTGDEAEADLLVPGAFGRVLDALADPGHAGAALEDLLDLSAAAQRPPRPASDGGAPGEPGHTLAISDPALDEPVAVQERDPRWFARAMSERDRLLRVLDPHALAIEHIGGTALPTVAGRPVVDLLVGVAGMPPDAAVAESFAAIGYSACGDAGTPGRLLFRRSSGARYDIHVVEHGGALWEDAVALREYLRRRPSEAHRWAAAKRDAARAAPTSFLSYCELRGPVLAEILDRMRASRREFAHDAGSPSPAA